VTIWMQCNAKTSKGHRCKNPVQVEEGKCHCHSENCPICLTVMGRGEEKSCGHRFHKRCIAKWLSRNNSCPLCRAVLKDTYKVTIFIQNVTRNGEVRRIEAPEESVNIIRDMLELPSAETDLFGDFSINLDIHGESELELFMEDFALPQ